MRLNTGELTNRLTLDFVNCAIDCGRTCFNFLFYFIWFLFFFLFRMPNETTKVWPINWLNDIFNMLAGREKIEKFRNLCSTRRSAGLPFMVQVIITYYSVNLANLLIPGYRNH